MPTPKSDISKSILTSEQIAKIETRALEVKELVGVGQFGEDMLALIATVKALKERDKTLEAVNAELIEGNHAAHIALDAAGIEREDVVWEGPIALVTEYPVCDRIGFLQSQLEALKDLNNENSV